MGRQTIGFKGSGRAIVGYADNRIHGAAHSRHLSSGGDSETNSRDSSPYQILKSSYSWLHLLSQLMGDSHLSTGQLN